MINVAIFNDNGKEKELILLGVKGRNVFDDIEQFKNQNYKVKISTVSKESLKAFLKAELISYEKQRRYWLNKRIELKQFIINLNIKDKIKQVLILRFIELKKRREISDILHYSLSYIDRLLKRGLFFIDEKLKSSSQKVVI